MDILHEIKNSKKKNGFKTENYIKPVVKTTKFLYGNFYYQAHKFRGIIFSEIFLD